MLPIRKQITDVNFSPASSERRFPEPKSPPGGPRFG
jgi:hypothetical protein